MANDKNFLIKNGLQAGRYLQTGGTETAGSEGYDLAGASYDSKSFSVASQETSPGSLFFKSDGTKMYVSGNSGDDVNEYALSTAWDVSTASYTTAFSVAANALNPEGLFFKPDGTKMYVFGISSSVIAEYDLSTAWDVSTASLNDTATFTSQVSVNTGQDITFNGDGTKLYIGGAGGTSSDIYQYSLSTAYDITTASYDSVTINVTTNSQGTADLTFNADGTRLYLVAYTPDTVAEYALTTAYDLSTASYNNVSFDISSQLTGPQGLYFKPDGTKMYINGQTSDAVFQYSTAAYTQTLDLSTGTYFSFTPSGATTVSFTNAPASGKAVGFAVEINGDGSAITWPSSVKWPSGVAPTATASKEVYSFVTTDGGTSYYGKLAGSDIQ